MAQPVPRPSEPCQVTAGARKQTQKTFLRCSDRSRRYDFAAMFGRPGGQQRGRAVVAEPDADDWFNGGYVSEGLGTRSQTWGFETAETQEILRQSPRSPGRARGRMIAFASIAGFVVLLALAASGVFSSGGAPPAKGTSPPSGSSRQPAGTLVALPAGVVRPGTVGSNVTEIQHALTSTGHSPGVADGVYGQRTELALQSFQRSAHLPVDGIYGPSTRKALETALRNG